MRFDWCSRPPPPHTHRNTHTHLCPPESAPRCRWKPYLTVLCCFVVHTDCLLLCVWWGGGCFPSSSSPCIEVNALWLTQRYWAFLSLAISFSLTPLYLFFTICLFFLFQSTIFSWTLISFLPFSMVAYLFFLVSHPVLQFQAVQLFPSAFFLPDSKLWTFIF